MPAPASLCHQVTLVPSNPAGGPRAQLGEQWCFCHTGHSVPTLEAATSCAVLAAISWEQTISSSNFPFP